MVIAAPDRPVKSCVVCGTAKLSLRINTASTTLAHFVAALVKRQLSVNEPTLLCGARRRRLACCALLCQPCSPLLQRQGLPLCGALALWLRPG